MPSQRWPSDNADVIAAGQGRPAPEWWWAASVESVAVTIRNAVEDCMMTRGVQRVAVEAVDELLNAARCGRLSRWRARQARTLLRVIDVEPRFSTSRRGEARSALRVLEAATHDDAVLANNGSSGATPTSGDGDAPAGDNDAVTAANGSSGATPTSGDGDAPAGDNDAVTAANGSSGATPTSGDGDAPASGDDTVHTKMGLPRTPPKSLTVHQKLKALGSLIRANIADPKSSYPRYQIVRFEDLQEDTLENFLEVLRYVVVGQSQISCAPSSAKAQMLADLKDGLQVKQACAPFPHILLALTRDNSTSGARNINMKSIVNRVLELSRNAPPQTDFSEILSDLIQTYQSPDYRRDKSPSARSIRELHRRSMEILENFQNFSDTHDRSENIASAAADAADAAADAADAAAAPNEAPPPPAEPPSGTSLCYRPRTPPTRRPPTPDTGLDEQLQDVAAALPETREEEENTASFQWDHGDRPVKKLSFGDKNPASIHTRKMPLQRDLSQNSDDDWERTPDPNMFSSAYTKRTTSP
ncbi:hypothetical protein ONE63_003535 [Megalurothrips usitatus]|uniref:Uncharacterized protein n=1 Tax=Megalurothrips usitatus TaxID=439358 RepID=A0AAV7X5T5_9NEOP|nr:hypothetical protein ONE63_003535 [Megalurothrips usitatus]